MRFRRVLLCLPEHASQAAHELAREVKAALSRTRQVRLQVEGEAFDDDETPVDGPNHKPLVLRIEEPPDGGEGIA